MTISAFSDELVQVRKKLRKSGQYAAKKAEHAKSLFSTT